MNGPISRGFQSSKGVIEMPKAKLPVVAVCVALAWAGTQFAAPAAMADSPAPPIQEKDVTVKRLDSGLSEIILPEQAARRLEIKTSEVRADASGRKVAPYSSIIYDLAGDSWVYSEVGPHNYERQEVKVERIKGGEALLKSGPPVGTKVVTAGSIELYGTEVGVNGE